MLGRGSCARPAPAAARAAAALPRAPVGGPGLPTPAGSPGRTLLARGALTRRARRFYAEVGRRARALRSLPGPQYGLLGIVGALRRGDIHRRARHRRARLTHGRQRSGPPSARTAADATCCASDCLFDGTQALPCMLPRRPLRSVRAPGARRPCRPAGAHMPPRQACMVHTPGSAVSRKGAPHLIRPPRTGRPPSGPRSLGPSTESASSSTMCARRSTAVVLRTSSLLF